MQTIEEAKATPPVADTDVDTEEDTVEEPLASQKDGCPTRPEKTRRQAPGAEVPQALPPPSCPLLALLVKDPKPWAKATREPDVRILRRLANKEADDAMALDADILEALNEASEAELDDAWNQARAAVSHTGLPIVFDFVEEERLFELALVEGAPAFYVGGRRRTRSGVGSGTPTRTRRAAERCLGTAQRAGMRCAWCTSRVAAPRRP
jgi:hypothetical protein